MASEAARCSSAWSHELLGAADEPVCLAHLPEAYHVKLFSGFQQWLDMTAVLSLQLGLPNIQRRGTAKGSLSATAHRQKRPCQHPELRSLIPGCRCYSTSRATHLAISAAWQQLRIQSDGFLRSQRPIISAPMPLLLASSCACDSVAQRLGPLVLGRSKGIERLNRPHLLSFFCKCQ